MDSTRLANQAASHHGVLLPSILEREGITPKQQRLRVAKGEWRRLPNGVLTVAGVPDSFELLATAALAAAPKSVLSHQSAAVVHGAILGGSDGCDQLVHLTVEACGRSRVAGAMLHRSPLERCDVVRRRGFALTNIERTAIDLGSNLGRNELQRFIEEQLVKRSTTFDRVEQTLLRVSASGRTGVAQVRSVLADLDGSPPNESELEAMFQRLLANHGLPRPRRQAVFEWSPTERGRVDCWFPQQALIVELDGRRFHARLDAYESDRRRDQMALVHGLKTVRFTHRQITGEAERVARVLQALLLGDSVC